MCIRDRYQRRVHGDNNIRNQFQQTIMFLQGVWRGLGKVIEGNLSYREELTITQLKGNVFSMIQRTQHPETGNALHSEQGYIRLFPESEGANKGRAEFIISHPFGVGEIEEGTYDETTVRVETTQLVRSATAREPYTTKLVRVFQFVDGRLSYKVQMATTKQDLYDHLEAVLERSA
eukprot:TRINITY_DN432_c0_g1_i8.p1 TRINITY_DN432_c0_g1~~TRINITY_DN432_c0_g1_i8.p1  ORF type:complete len:176 (-),score=44.08 TRINITY_DN432_c0_g1_i8:219-746(-)